jgi:hypothetical protein
MSHLPRISLITPCLDQAPFLEECLRSIHDQQYPDLEHIVVDGGSTDGSVEIIQRYQDRIAWWCSEKDHGQSDAINKGLSHATGEIFGWLNSDDLLHPGALHTIAGTFMRDPDAVIVQGRRWIMQPDGSRSPLPQNDPADPEALFALPKVDQQSTFHRMEAVRAAGGVDPALHHVMDLELWWRILFRHGTGSLRIIPEDIAIFRMHGESKTGGGLMPFVVEQAAVLHSACQVVGEDRLARILEIGHDLPKGIRPMDVAAGHGDMVRKMVLAFLLKWNRVIHTEGQFNMMRELRRTFPLDPADHPGLQELDSQLAAGSWTLFRARRKLRHLFG